MPTSVTSPKRLSAANARAQVKAKAADIGMVPVVAARALEITSNPECSISEFASVVERDMKLAADILSIANSAIYSPSKPILSLSQAVIRLGFQQSKNLILSSSVSALLKKLPLGEEWIRESLCRHSFMTGLLAVKLNRSLNLEYHGEEFTAGLLHDFGRILFAVCFPIDFPQLDQMTFDEDGFDLLKHERTMIGIDHCELGVWYAQENRLPEVLVDAIRFHHTPQVVNAGRLPALIAASDHIANHLQRHGTANDYDIASNTAVVVLQESGDSGITSRFSDIVVPLMEEAMIEVDELIGF